MDRVTSSVRNLTTEAAHAAVAAAVAQARIYGIRVNAAVVDASGLLMAFLRMDSAYLHSIDIAIDKAYTAASFGFSTDRWGPVLESDAALGAGLPTIPRLIVFGGGVPAYEDGQCVGAVGVSGGSAAQDAACASAAVAAIGLRTSPQ